MNFNDALDCIKGTPFMMYSISSKVQFMYIDSQLHWTHFGSVGGVVNAKMLRDYQEYDYEDWEIETGTS